MSVQCVSKPGAESCLKICVLCLFAVPRKWGVLIINEDAMTFPWHLLK